MNFDLIQPCADCPFRTDRPFQKGWLGAERAKDITDSILEKDGTFACHKTTHLHDSKWQHCAGATIMCEANDKPNQMMRISERLGCYDRHKVKMDSPVFTDPDEFGEWHTIPSK